MRYVDLISRMNRTEKASLLSGLGFWQTMPLERLAIPSIFLADGPHGIRKQMAEADQLGLNPGVPATCFPTASAIANSWNTTLVEEVGRTLGEEAVAYRVNMILGPGLNIKRSPLCGRNFEYFSEDPHLAGKLAAASIRGIQSAGVAACPKHFAANSQELLRMASDSVVDDRALREIYLTAFEIAVKEAKPWAVMSSYNKVNGVYANENRLLLRDILKDQWGFGGIVVSDWGGGNDCCAGVIAGSHLEMPGTEGNSAMELLDALESGAISEAVADERVDELLTTIFAVQIPKDAPTTFDTEAHHRIARKAAEESIVLLKNENAILPLKKGSKVALIGDFAETPRFQGAGSSQVNATKVDSALSLIGESGLDCVGFQPGFERQGKPKTKNTAPVNREAAIALAKQADIVLFYMGLDEIGETEGLDRSDLRVRENQIELLNAIHQVNPNIVAVLHAGSVVETPWLDQCRALVLVALSGQAGAGAVLDALTGKICPSGKLSETWTLTLKDSPAFYYYPGKEKTAEYRESIFVGYRYYDSAGGSDGIPVRFPFGFGLSYTEFSYSDLSLNNEGVSFTITNAGKTAGAEIAQVYVSLPDSRLYRAKKELKGFVKVFLQSGESKTVNIPFDDTTFRYFDTETKGFEVEGGAYQVCIGASSRDIRLSGALQVDSAKPGSQRSDAAALPSYFSAQVKQVSDDEFARLLGRTPPPSRWNRSAPLSREDSIAQLFYAKSLFARFVWKILSAIKASSEAKGKPNLNILFIYNMPLRGIAKMSGQVVNMPMIDAILEIVNGHFFKGLGHLLKEYRRMIKRRKSIRLQNGGIYV